jgi:hypothetical protein
MFPRHWAWQSLMRALSRVESRVEVEVEIEVGSSRVGVWSLESERSEPRLRSHLIASYRVAKR